MNELRGELFKPMLWRRPPEKTEQGVEHIPIFTIPEIPVICITTNGFDTLKNLAIPHFEDGIGNLKTVKYISWDNIAPAGGINSNISDMSNWIKMLLNEGKYNGKDYRNEEKCPYYYKNKFCHLSPLLVLFSFDCNVDT